MDLQPHVEVAGLHHALRERLQPGSVSRHGAGLIGEIEHVLGGSQSQQARRVIAVLEEDQPVLPAIAAEADQSRCRASVLDFAPGDLLQAGHRLRVEREGVVELHLVEPLPGPSRTI